MFYFDHGEPHVHAICHGKKAVIRIEDAEILRGNLDRSARRVAIEWVRLYKSQLLSNWREMKEGKEPKHILI